MRYFLGVDIGTSSTKAVITDEKLNILSQGRASYNVEMPKPLWAQQSANVWLEGFVEATKEAIEKAKIDNVEALCVSGLYGGSGVPLDKNMEPLGPALIWMDKRATEETEWVKKHIGVEKLFEITANYVDPYFGFTKILWMKNHGPNWKKFNLLLSPKDYVIFKLTGQIATDYSSAGNIGGVFDLKKRNWSNELLQEMNIPRSLFPDKIVPSNAVVGNLNTDFASILGIKVGTPVVSGGIDAAVATYAAGVEKSGEHVAMIGTSMCWGTIHDGRYLTSKMVNMPYVIDPMSNIYSFGGATTAGAILEWFKRELAPNESLEELEEKAKEIPPGSEGVKVEPYFMGERAPLWDPTLRGKISGLTLSTTRAHIYRAFLESIADSLRLNVNVAKETGIPLKDEIYVVGGITKSSLSMQIISDYLKMKVKTLSSSLDAPIGDVKLAINRILS
jgi:sugar (pentulose or hexulose) kinase